MAGDYDYVKAGTLPPPGPIGSVVRLGLGIACLDLVLQLIISGWGMVGQNQLARLSWWPYVALAVAVFPDVFNVGLSLSVDKKLLRGVLIAAMAALGLMSKAALGSFTGAPLGVFVLTWLLYTYGHLGTSLVLASVLRTPGCEMRAFPHLWSLVSGTRTREHYCPGLLDPLDRWERARARPGTDEPTNGS